LFLGLSGSPSQATPKEEGGSRLKAGMTFCWGGVELTLASLPACAGMTKIRWEGAVARKRELTLVGGSERKLRKRAVRDWSVGKAKAFLGALAETCNVSEACRTSGVPMTVAYRQRKLDAGFRASWIEAVGTAYSRLELILLERAFSGVERIIRHKDGSESRMREYSDALGLKLLQMHQATATEANSQVLPEDVDEIRKRLVSKLQRLKKRNEQEQEAERAQLRGAPRRDGDVVRRDAGAAAQDHRRDDSGEAGVP